MTTRSCATCKHLIKRPPEWVKDHYEQPEGHTCGVLYVATNHPYQTPFFGGDIVTWSQAQRHRIKITPLIILNPEPFACRAWNADELTMPDRWKPAAEYDSVFDAFKGRYVRRDEYVITGSGGFYRLRREGQAA